MSTFEIMLLTLSALGTVYYILSTLALIVHFAGFIKSAVPQNCRAVSILKPVCGSDPNAHSNYQSYLQQHYPRYEVIFGALDPGDPAIADVEKAIKGSDQVSFYIGSKAEGHNNKVKILDNLIQYAAGEIVVISDADTRVTPDAISQIIQPCDDPSVGLVTCMYRGIEAKSKPDHIEALYMTTVFEPGVACSKALHINFCLGALVAVRKPVLDAIGGFEPMLDYLADDFKLGQLVRKAGYKVILSDYVVDIALSGDKFDDVLARQLRWSQTLRLCNPLGHFGLIVTHGLPFSLLFLITSRFSSFGLYVFLSCIGIRCITAYAGSRCCLKDMEFPKRAYLLPLSDLLAFFTWAAAYFSSMVKWRGRKLKLAKDGKIISCL